MRRAPSTSIAPWEASRKAVARPIPLLAPVIAITLLFTFSIAVLHFDWSKGIACDPAYLYRSVLSFVEIVRNMTDALTSIFSLLDLRSARCTRLEAAGAWSLRFPEKLALKFAAVIQGECWMLHPDHPPVQMAQGDVFLLSQTPAYVLASDPQLPPEDGAKVIDWESSDVGRYGGADTVLLGGSFRVNPLHEHLLTEALPHLMLLPRDAPAASTLSRTLEIMEGEFRQIRMGSDLIRRHLADMLLVQMLRAFAERDVQGMDRRPPSRSWIGALTDPRLGAALDRIHAEPGRSWTVKALSEVAGMSRTSFAEAFHVAIGQTPIDYVTRWRMQIGEDLIHQGLGIADVAATLGYGSQSAFGTAFKRIKGCSPKVATRQSARSTGEWK
ncbi:AraC family transcriptional regulator [Rhizobium sp. R693]|uniref:AraC family transcriptional regulator n=1 Tax=Rhizobium sp. R693 TaxID=1764276 RepID=UPI001FD8E094|nr:AraC family transcriptional regulator [Rhizobium sp. R693]